jgi:hypothetical protein
MLPWLARVARPSGEPRGGRDPRLTPAVRRRSGRCTRPGPPGVPEKPL